MRGEKEYLTLDEYKSVKEILTRVTTHLPKDDSTLRTIWSSYVKVSGIQQPQPCSCASSGGLWLQAVDTLRKYISDNAEPEL